MHIKMIRLLVKQLAQNKEQELRITLENSDHSVPLISFETNSWSLLNQQELFDLFSNCNSLLDEIHPSAPD